MSEPLITLVIPSLNQGQFIEEALTSVFKQKNPVEVFIMDGGSTDATLDVIRAWEPRIAGWRSHSDGGQASAINEGIAQGTAPFVCWLNSDDLLLPGGLDALVAELSDNPDMPAVYGRSWDANDKKNKKSPAWVEPFREKRLALRCIISQPATLIRRSAWEQLGGLDERLHLAMDYDLWWRLYKAFGPLTFVDKYVAVNRIHEQTKTQSQRRRHYQEAMGVVRNHYGSVPIKWWVYQPYAVWFRSLRGLVRAL